MQRIDTPDKLFHDGNPATGAMGTPVSAGFLNAIQEEIARAIELAGIEVNPASSEQLYAAIIAIIASNVNAPLVVATTPPTKVGDLIFVVDRWHWAVWVETAFYTGYRSLNCGDWYIGSMCQVHRPQEIDGIGGIVDIAAYPSLWAWAQENGHVVDAVDWEPRGTKYALIGTTQFRLPDYRNMFPRAAGTDADTANEAGPGYYQADALQDISGTLLRIAGGVGGGVVPSGAFYGAPEGSPVNLTGGSNANGWNLTFSAGRVARVSTETRGAASRVLPVVLI